MDKVVLRNQSSESIRFDKIKIIKTVSVEEAEVKLLLLFYDKNPYGYLGLGSGSWIGVCNNNDFSIRWGIYDVEQQSADRKIME